MFRSYFLSFARICFLFMLIIANANVNAQAFYPQGQSEKVIQNLYQNLKAHPTSSLHQRLNQISAYFLGKPYLLGALGEGENGVYDQYPLFRTDAFDCETYVTTMLALSLAHNNQDFQSWMQRLRYYPNQVSFTQRNHFTCIEWNKHNHDLGVLKDITLTIRDRSGRPVAKTAHAWIDKAAWYQCLTLKNIRLRKGNLEEQQKRLQALKKEGSQFKPLFSELPYLPFDALFQKDGKANFALFAQIPDGAIIEIVRPNWDLSAKIGTHLNVSHLGFAFWKDKVLYFREASSEYKKVVDVPLITYLRKAQATPSIQGINIQIAQRPIKSKA